MLKVIKEIEGIRVKSGKKEVNKRRWLCQCDCGNQLPVITDSLRNGNTKSCGCNKNEWISEKNSPDLTGKRFSKLKVLRRNLEKTNNNHTFWECQCDCGNTTVVDSSNLISGNTKSCGCLSPIISKEQCINEMISIYEKHGKVTTKELNQLLTFSYNTMKKKFPKMKINAIWDEIIKEYERRKNIEQ
ncbi:hypothetical protein [Heyndrickxia sporothermodurans]|uniref:Uncharacterized protein n=2 Tax=Bacillaceae TaxID=186817 RepID=A0AB37HGL7_9BACI|nr:hypothetical protein JGZ69_03020 [Heyndrickxia sporothermodurans]